MIALVAVAVGVLVGVSAGGDLRRLASTRLRGETVLCVLLVAEVLLPLLRVEGIVGRVAFLVWILTLPAGAVVALWNWRLPGMAAVGVGLLLNTAVVVANGGMPVLPEAALAAGGSAGSWVAATGDFVHGVATSATRLLPLADVAPVPWPMKSVASAGDIVMLVGLAALVGGMQVQRGGLADRRHRSSVESAFDE